MAFKSVDEFADQYGRMTILVYGKYRVGKTTLALRIAQSGELVYMLSVDFGLRAAVFNPGPYRNTLVVSEAGTMGELRKDIRDISTRITQKVAANKDGMKRWIIVDNLSHLQANLLHECRKVAVSGEFNPKIKDAEVRDMVTQADWNINLSLMMEVVNMVMQVPCNVVLLCHEMREKITGLPTPQIAGQAHGRILGAVDVIARLVRDENDNGQLIVRGDDNMVDASGFRGDPNLLNDVEPADLCLLRNKYLVQAREPAQETNNKEKTNG